MGGSLPLGGKLALDKHNPLQYNIVMDKKRAKENIIINYWSFCDDVKEKLRYDSPHLRSFIERFPDLNADKDILVLAEKYANFVKAFKELDTVVNKQREEIDDAPQ